MIMEEKVFFVPGDVVRVKQDINNKPYMVVKSIDKVAIRKTGVADGVAKSTLFGITCFWFTEQGALQEHRFNTKDLTHVD